MRQPTLSRWRRFTCQNETTQGKNCFAASACVIAGALWKGGEMSKSGTFRASGRWGRAVDSPGVFRVKVMSSWMFAATWKTSLLPWIFPMSKKAALLDPQLWCIARSTLPLSHDTLRVDDHFLSSSRWKLWTFTHLELGLSQMATESVVWNSSCTATPDFTQLVIGRFCDSDAVFLHL